MKTFLEVTLKKGLRDLCERKVVRKSRTKTKNVSGKFAEIQTKILRTPKICLLLHRPMHFQKVGRIILPPALTL